jgi:hypothetical protein
MNEKTQKAYEKQTRQILESRVKIDGWISENCSPEVQEAIRLLRQTYIYELELERTVGGIRESDLKTHYLDRLIVQANKHANAVKDHISSLRKARKVL